jgi:2-polyprenyl-6-hydroxyphenyl methylase/3-demethylubiquinone-9 3-methyltransferase
LLNLLPKGTHEYSKFIKPSELIHWCNESGLVLKSIIGMTYNPITKRYKLGNDVSVNYMVQISFLNE